MSHPKILIVDDESKKILGIVGALQEKLTFEYETALTSRCAMKKMQKIKFDLLIIDLQLPEDLKEEVSIDGGVNLLKTIHCSTLINKPKNIIGITSHDDSYQSCKYEFEKNGWVLYLDTGEYDVISEAISNQLEYAKTEQIYSDIVIITALEHTELQAVLSLSEWIKFSVLDDYNTYYKTTIVNKDGQNLILIATSCHDMGMANASAITMKACLKFSPKYVLMLGIAAGIEGKVALGDILIADTCWDWGNGKQTITDGKPEFLASPKQMLLDESLKMKLRSLVVNKNYLEEIYQGYLSDLKPSEAPNIYMGPIASGAVVLENPDIVAAIKKANRETIGIEMEAYGVMIATKLSGSSPPISLIIKSVCDFADPSKDDIFQGYAAYTSAKYAFKLIENELEF
ncbi:phosphorylase family protein [Wohlfahrtiimonas populi]|uniref:phosphorylase family protein n=1 Tax=Wohlfahrtiimonas populi TaxID=1940240 RepID=UPI00098CF205|nr:response regulator [Wohlfahrtiimonas populi]